jgi:D,D-heptose 1,7-bisphosphate phosphatase
MKHRAVFVDRDGTIIHEADYLKSLAQVKFIRGTYAALTLLKKCGFKIIVVTNQSGVARGFFSEEFVHATHEFMQKKMRAHNAGADAFYYCPHHPEGKIKKYAKPCRCRKPGTGMLEQAAKDFNLDLKHSYMIGDHASDIQMGKKKGLKSIFVLTGHGDHELGRLMERDVRPDLVAPTVREAAKWIVKDSPRA